MKFMSDEISSLGKHQDRKHQENPSIDMQFNFYVNFFLLNRII